MARKRFHTEPRASGTEKQSLSSSSKGDRARSADEGEDAWGAAISAAPEAAGGETGGDVRRRPYLPTRPVWMLFTSLLSLVGGILGTRLAVWYVGFIRPYVEGSAKELDPGLYWFSLSAFTLVGLLLGFLLASMIFRQLMIIVPRLESMPLEDKIAGFLGVFVGFGIAYLLAPLLVNIRYRDVGILLVWAMYVLLGFLGPFITLSMKREIVTMLRVPSIGGSGEGEWHQVSRIKLLDTNVIIDGRIADICRAGFLEGPVLLPEFILRELHQIADSEDDLRRARGRRGLDMLREMQEDPAVDLHILRDYGIKFGRGEPVDMRLINLARHLKAFIVTNDYNLNKLARVEGVQVLNVNALANALKPVVLPGEEMSIQIVKEGREAGQGVGYLDDGTMVVVEEGLRYVGQEVGIIVSSVLQTAAGKMIFGAPKAH